MSKTAESYIEHSTQSQSGDDAAAALRREVSLLGAAASQLPDAISEAFSEDALPWTSGKVLLSVGLGYGISRFVPGGSIGSQIIKSAGGAMMVSLAKDVALDGAKVCGILAETWNTDANFAANTAVLKDCGSKLFTDFLLMTAGASAGSALASRFSNRPIAAALSNSGLTSSETALSTSGVIVAETPKLALAGGESLSVAIVERNLASRPYSGILSAPSLAAAETQPAFSTTSAGHLRLGVFDGSELRFNALPAAPSIKTGRTLTAVPEKDILDKMAELERLYKVRFTSPESRANNPWHLRIKSQSSIARVPWLERRLPIWDELVGLEAALERSIPSNLGSQGLTFNFYDLPRTLHARLSDMSGAVWSGSRIHFQPGSRILDPLNAAEERLWGQRTMQSLATHEIAHNGQYNVKLFDEKVLEPLATRLGWVKAKTGGPDAWLFESQGGQQYRFDASTRQWHYAGGEPRSSKDPHWFTSDDLRKRAAVRPISDYFDNPVEMITEGMTIFRSGPAQREWLSYKSRPLYSVVKEVDQLEIHRFFKPKGNQPRLTRNLEGKLEPETPELRDYLKILE